MIEFFCPKEQIFALNRNLAWHRSIKKLIRWEREMIHLKMDLCRAVKVWRSTVSYHSLFQSSRTKMYGLICENVSSFIKHRYGDDTWDNIRRLANIDSPTFSVHKERRLSFYHLDTRRCDFLLCYRFTLSNWLVEWPKRRFRPLTWPTLSFSKKLGSSLWSLSASLGKRSNISNDLAFYQREKLISGMATS